MPALFQKLNLRAEREILVLEAPASFEQELAALNGIRVVRSIKGATLDFVLVFVTRRAQIGRIWKSLAARAQGDAIIWFAYPKGSSKRYRSDINRDNGWDEVRTCGWDTVRQVAIDEDWSALRFRRNEFINRRAAPRSR